MWIVAHRVTDVLQRIVYDILYCNRCCNNHITHFLSGENIAIIIIYFWKIFFQLHFTLSCYHFIYTWVWFECLDEGVEGTNMICLASDLESIMSWRRHGDCLFNLLGFMSSTFHYVLQHSLSSKCGTVLFPSFANIHTHTHTFMHAYMHTHAYMWMHISETVSEQFSPGMIKVLLLYWWWCYVGICGIDIPFIPPGPDSVVLRKQIYHQLSKASPQLEGSSFTPISNEISSDDSITVRSSPCQGQPLHKAPFNPYSNARNTIHTTEHWSLIAVVLSGEFFSPC